MDVLRSYANEPRVPSDKLKEILKAYTVYNPDVGYCQGMNFITGTLLYCIQDPELSFLSLVGLIQKFHLENLYAPELPRLKLLFLSAGSDSSAQKLPEVYALFKTEMMSSGQFASSWFITLFSVVLQNNQELLLEIWSLFYTGKIYLGWMGKVLFKSYSGCDRWNSS
jgi:TBC1 domain family member 10